MGRVSNSTALNCNNRLSRFFEVICPRTIWSCWDAKAAFCSISRRSWRARLDQHEWQERGGRRTNNLLELLVWDGHDLMLRQPSLARDDAGECVLSLKVQEGWVCGLYSVLAGFACLLLACLLPTLLCLPRLTVYQLWPWFDLLTGLGPYRRIINHCTLSIAASPRPLHKDIRCLAACTTVYSKNIKCSSLHRSRTSFDLCPQP